MIRIIAFITMLIDHIARIYFPDNLILSIIGRLSFPLFAWGIAMGYTRTINYKKYIIRLLILAVISQLPYSLLFKNNYINICFTLLTGIVAIKIYNTKISEWVKWIGIITLLIISQVGGFEYGMYGVLTIFIFYLFGNKDYIIVLQGVLTLLSIIIFKYEALQLFSVFSTLLILFLSKQDFKLNRLLQYGFYPVHLIVILLLTFIIPGR